jgi:hypothetical protein
MCLFEKFSSILKFTNNSNKSVTKQRKSKRKNNVLFLCAEKSYKAIILSSKCAENNMSRPFGEKAAQYKGVTLQENKNSEDTIALRTSLENITREGVFLYIEDRLSSPDEICRECIAEEAIYMADYIMDEFGQLKELRYNKVAIS